MPSSVIRWMRYDPEQRSLWIAFRKGVVYCYFDVPPSEWEAFRRADSKGTYLNTVFKDGGFGFEPVATSSVGGFRRYGLYFWGESS